MSTWVFLRGLMREQRHWDAFPAQFGQAVPQARIVTPDLPGNGTRHRMASASRVADMVEFCRGELAAQGCAAPYHVLALSLGGMVAVEWAARYPDEIAALVLINTSMRPFSPFYRRLRWQNYGALAALALLGGAARQERLILRLTSADGAGRAGLLPRWIGYQRDYPVARANALRQLLSAARYRAPPRRPAAATLVLASSNDRLVDARCSLRLAEHWGAPCRLHASAGHDLPLDDGAWVAQQVRRWLDSLRGE
ncbi:pimeloyl-ACP methyl ester carboxylesterase [Janthinobacterium sp. CG_23.3]|uniref:alpha/beta fold hydrolase n=1 Tax=Janthinobacterium sp. CG_23.3 TaxID=3349634 RepID=UPI0038D41437